MHLRPATQRANLASQAGPLWIGYCFQETSPQSLKRPCHTSHQLSPRALRGLSSGFFLLLLLRLAFPFRFAFALCCTAVLVFLASSRVPAPKFLLGLDEAVQRFPVTKQDFDPARIHQHCVGQVQVRGSRVVLKTLIWWRREQP